MTIKRSEIAEPISANIYTKEIPRECPRCKIGKLGPRIYRPHELIAGEIPRDADQWLMCEFCGPDHVIPKHDVPQKGQLTTDVERITSKFTTQKGDEHYQPPKHRRGFNERLSEDKEDDGIKDTEVRAAIKKGQKVISYSEK